jgi:hypothetical protein
MGPLEHITFVLHVAVEKDEIGKAELMRILGMLSHVMSTYDIDRDTIPELNRLSDILAKRFEHVIHPKGARK